MSMSKKYHHKDLGKLALYFYFFKFRFSSTNKMTSAINLYFVAAKELLKRAQINSGFGIANKIIELIC
jgi:hypothetical protein